MNNCYCGHPKERHRVYMRNFTECLHCACSLYAESQEPKALEDCRFCPTKNGVHIHPCIKDVECQRCGLPYDAHTQILDHGFKAKPQKEPKKCCDKCNRKQLGGGTSCIDLQCPCHQKETKPTINKPLWN